ncbi:MAG TPA: alpha-L-rhamnosidase C-terminal domain-containing protein [Vicinamibacteria bacterium]|nr:alpha-L-rhamnosidase C-terminal domain-containing protein [Vicinamibacteria bacterium]
MKKSQGDGRRQDGAGTLRRREVLKASAAVLGSALAPAGLASAGAAAAPAAPRAADATGSPFPPLFEKAPWDRQGSWPAWWVGCADACQPPVVTAYRLRFDWPRAGQVRLRVSADERYELFLDGRRIARGPERGTVEHWFYDTVDVAPEAGAHVLLARVFSLGPFAPLAQFQVHPGFLLAAEGPASKRLDTGVAAWEAKPLSGYAVEPPVYVWGLAAPVTVEGEVFPWGFERGLGEGWRPVARQEQAASALLAYGIAPSRYLQAGTLPAMIERPWTRGRVRHVAAVPSLDTLPVPVRAADHLAAEAASWEGMLAGQAPVEIPAHTRRRVIVDLEDYVCAYPELVASGGKGGLVRLQLAEGLREQPDRWKFVKGNRDEIEGKFFFGMGDRFRPDGGERRLFESLWFASGRYLEIVVETAGEPLRIDRLALAETRYPLELESRWSCSDAALVSVLPLLVRGMQACAHETFFDCPYFEQMQYLGDLRLEALVQYVMTRDDRLTRKGLYLVDASRHACGLTESRYPVREPQFIPWFSLIWIGAVHDYARWRDDPGFVRSLLPGVRAVLEAFVSRRTSQGVAATPEGWNDSEGTREPEVSALTNWLLVWTLRLAAELEDGFGEPEPGARWRRHAAALAAAADRVFWLEAAGLYSDEPGGRVTSELVQSIALLGGTCPAARRERLARGLFGGEAGTRSDVHTLHYLFEAARLLRRPEVVLDRLSPWSQMRRNGLRTPIESAEPTRSDCHAWGSHPLYHFFATLLGIRPSGWGFRQVDVTPMLGGLEHASGRLVHPAGGEIVVEAEQKEGAIHGRVVLPPGLAGRLQLPSGLRPLVVGETRF